MTAAAVALPGSGALTRLQHSARRQFLRYGKLRPFQLYAATRDLDAGSESWEASGDPIQAACMIDHISVRRQSPGSGNWVTHRETVLLVEIPAFSAAGGLTGDYRWTDFEGTERQLQNVVLSEDGTYYIARLGSGA